jgi:hypothetical protein
MGFPSDAPLAQVNPQLIPLKMAGGNHFGRYNKISDEQTWNMIVSEGALVDYAGYQNLFPAPLVANASGRGIYSSNNGHIMIVVIGSAVYSISQALAPTFIGNLQTSQGDVFISENNASQIAIADESFLYVYNYKTPTTPKLLQSIGMPLPPAMPPAGRFFAPFVTPGYVSFQNGRLIVADLNSQNWWLSGINDALQWSLTDTSNKAYQGSITVKPDTIQAAVPIPGAGNLLAVFGHTVMEMWQDVGNAVFPYQRSSTYNVDYGCLNASSIAALDSTIVWLSANEQGGATIMKIDGAGAREQSISTDGIDFKLSEITDPTNCTGFLFRQDGHLIYQFTFPTNNLSYVYDFNTNTFFTVSDEDQNYHIARNVVFFNNDYYFVSLNDGNVYTFGTQFSSLQYSATNIQQMPRIRITPPIRLPSQRMFICKSVGFTIENGQPNERQISFGPIYLITQDGKFLITQGTEEGLLVSQDDNYFETQDGNLLETQQPSFTDSSFLIAQQMETFIDDATTECIDLRVSRDGGESFSSAIRYYMNPTGQRQSRLTWWRLGQSNDLTIQIQFIGFQRFIAFDGIVEAYT